MAKRVPLFLGGRVLAMTGGIGAVYSFVHREQFWWAYIALGVSLAICLGANVYLFRQARRFRNQHLLTRDRDQVP